MLYTTVYNKTIQYSPQNEVQSTTYDYNIVTDYLEKLFIDNTNKLETRTFTNETVKTILQNGSYYFTYKNQSVLNYDPVGQGLYDSTLTMDAEKSKIFVILANGTEIVKDLKAEDGSYDVVETYVDSTATYQSTYNLDTNKVKQNLINYVYYKNPVYEIEKSIQKGTNTTFYYRNGDLKEQNNFGSYNLLKLS